MLAVNLGKSHEFVEDIDVRVLRFERESGVQSAWKILTCEFLIIFRGHLGSGQRSPKK